MKRIAIAAGVLLTLAAAPGHAGYYIVRIVLEGGGEAANTGPEGGPMLPPIAGPASGFGRGGGGGEGQPGPGAGRGGIATQPPLVTGPGVSTTPPAVDPYRSVVVVVPFTKPYEDMPFYPKGTNIRWAAVFVHPYGRTNLFDDKTTYQVYTDFQNTPPPPDPILPKGSKTYQILILERFDRWARMKNDPPALFNLIVEALEHGMVTQAVDWSRELSELCERTKPQLPARIVSFLDAYRAIKDDLDRLPPLKNDVDEWKDIVDVVIPGTQKPETRKHYSIIHWDANPMELNSRFTRLEDNFKAFYLFHAIQGIKLKTPSRPLITLLLKGADEFTPLRMAFAGRDPKLNQLRPIDEDFFASRHDFVGLPPLTDAFLAPHHNIAVFSPERIDGIGRSFRMSNRNLYREGMTRQMLLAGDGPPITDTAMNPMNPLGPGATPGPGGGRPGGEGQPGPMQPDPKAKGPITRSKEEVARAMTTAFVERYDEDATDIAAVSCEGSRQLLYASDMFPEHIDLPIWLTTGAGEFYQRPRNTVYTPTTDNKAIMAIGLTTGYGRPNFAMQYRFARIVSDKEFKSEPPTILRNILTDSYFTAAILGKDLDDAANLPKTGADEVKRLVALRMKARVMSWALYYDLIKNQPTEFMAFLANLKRLPRDVAIDRHTHLLLFAHAFRLTDNTGQIDEAAFNTFADGWLRRIRQVTPAWETVEVTTPLPSAGGANPGGGQSPLGPMLPSPTGSKD